MQAHGGGVALVNGPYYLIGENKQDGSAFQSVNCYSSSDLVTWTFVNQVLKLQGSGDLGPNRVIERSHTMYIDGTKKWVMWMHVDSSSYGEAKAGVATCDTVCGGYTYM
jgi:beta-xylosidase